MLSRTTTLIFWSGAAAVVFALGTAEPAAAQSDVAFPPEVYAARRARLAAQLGAPVIVPSEYMIHHDGVKKQEPNFFYLTGVESPYSILYLEPDGTGGVREVLFLPGHREFAGAQYPHQDPRLVDAAWNRMIRRLEPGPHTSSARHLGSHRAPSGRHRGAKEETSRRPACPTAPARTVWPSPPGCAGRGRSRCNR